MAPASPALVPPMGVGPWAFIRVGQNHIESRNQVGSPGPNGYICNLCLKCYCNPIQMCMMQRGAPHHPSHDPNIS